MMQNRPVRSRDYCEKSLTRCCNLEKKEREGGKNKAEKKHTQLDKKWEEMGSDSTFFYGEQQQQSKTFLYYRPLWKM